MFKNFFSSKSRSAVAILKKKGIDVKALQESLSSKELDMLCKYIEENLLEISFKVLHAPLNLSTNLGDILYPLVIELKNNIFVFLTWEEEWDLETAREMLVIMGLLKRKLYLNANFVIISPYKIPEILKYFLEDLPRNRFHLLNFVDLAVERVGGSMVKLFLRNFKESFGERLTEDINSLKVFDKIASKHLKPIKPSIQYSEPVKASMFLIKRYVEQVFLKETKAIYQKLPKSKKNQKQTPVLEYEDSYFLVDFRSKVFYEFSSEGNFKFSDLVLQIKKCLKDPSFIPDKDTFPFFQWVFTLKESAKRKTSKNIKNIIEKINKERQNQIKKQKEHSPILTYKIFQCPRCKSLFKRKNIISQFPLFTMDTFMQKAHQEASYEGDFQEVHEICPECDEPVNYKNLKYFKMCRYLPDVKWDIHYSMERFSDGKLVGSWHMYHMDGNVKYLGHNIHEKDIFSAIGRYISAVPLWKNLFETAIETKKIDLTTVEEYYYIMVIPPLPEEEKKKQLKAILEPLQLSGRKYMQFNMLKVSELPLYSKEYSFHQWLPEYSHLIINGTYDAIVFFDVEGYIQKVEKIMKSLNLSYLKEGNTYRVFRKDILEKIDTDLSPTDKNLPALPYLENFISEFKPTDLIPEIIHHGMNPSELILIRLGEITQHFDLFENLIDNIRKIVGEEFEIKYISETATLHITPKGEEHPWKIDVRKYIEKFGYEDENLEKALRSMFMLEEKSLNKCSCGREAYISLKIKPAQWIVDLSEFEESGVIAQKWKDNFLVFHKQCEEHTQYITEEMLNSWNVSMEELMERYEIDIPRNTFNIQVYTGTIEGHPLIGVIGEDAASISLQPEWIKRIIEEVPYILPQRCRIYAPTTDTLIITNNDVPDDVIYQFSQKVLQAQYAVLGSKEVLDLMDEVPLPTKGSGKINVTYIGEIK